MEEKLFGYSAKEWMLAFLEAIDGNSAWYDIQYHTGLPEEDCKRLEKMFSDATKNGWPT